MIFDGYRCDVDLDALFEIARQLGKYFLIGCRLGAPSRDSDDASDVRRFALSTGNPLMWTTVSSGSALRDSRPRAAKILSQMFHDFLVSDQLDGDSEMRLATNASFTIVFPSIVDNQKTVDEIV